MALYIVEKPMGAGKTLIATIIAKLYALRNPNNEIYTNFRLNLDNAVYTPFMFFPLSKLENCMIIIDDMEAMDNLKRLQSIITNISRKKNLEIYCTGQYYTQFPPKMRSLAKYVIIPSYSTKSKDLFYAYEYRDNKGNVMKRVDKRVIRNVQFAFPLYDTTEVVAFPLESDIKKQILKHSETKRDLELNIFLYEGNARKREKLREELFEKKGFKVDSTGAKNYYDKEKFNLWYANKIAGITQTKLAQKLDTHQSRISEIVRKVEYELREEVSAYM